MRERTSPPLLFFADDWGRHPSSSQYLARELLREHEIYWVNTIGMRKPRLDLATFKRGCEKLRHWRSRATPETKLPEGLQVSSPRMWPWFTHRWDRWLNRRLLSRSLGALVASMPAPPIAVTTLPIVAEILDLPVARWVYYCVDDFSTWPGLDHATLHRLETKLVQQVDSIVAVSEHLQARLQSMGRDSQLLTHGVDLEFWRSPSGLIAQERRPTGAKPWFVFYGVVDRRMNREWVAELSARMTEGTIVLVGPHAEPDPSLLQLPRVQALGAWPLEQLPALAAESAVLVMPYADLPVTRAMQPLKLKEYLATGRPCVVANLPATQPWGDCLDVVSTATEFASRVLLRAQTGVPVEQQQARVRIEQESWQAKARAFQEMILTPQQETKSSCLVAK